MYSQPSLPGCSKRTKNMNSHCYKPSGLSALCLLLTLTVLTSGCKVTNRRPLQIAPLKTTFAAKQTKLVVRFDDTLPRTNLNLTVWDNVVGPFGDAKEAKQIGYTQNYNKVMVAGAAGGPIAATAAAPMLIETRIVIPFGPIFIGTLQSGLQQAFPNAVIVTNPADDAEASATSSAKYQVYIRVAEFRVWEGPMNHINLTTKVTCRVQQVGEPAESGSTFEVQRQATKQQIGTVLSTSGGFIRKMNEISNTFAGDVAMEILETLQKTTGP